MNVNCFDSLCRGIVIGVSKQIANINDKEFIILKGSIRRQSKTEGAKFKDNFFIILILLKSKKENSSLL